MEAAASDLIRHLDLPIEDLDGHKSPPTSYHNFIVQAKNEREFVGDVFDTLTRSLVTRRLCADRWASCSNVEVCCVTKVLRLMARSTRLRELLSTDAVVAQLAVLLKSHCDACLLVGTGSLSRSILIEGCSTVEKILSNAATHPLAVAHGLHLTFGALLSVGEQMVVRTSLVALRRLAKSVQAHPEVCSLTCVRMLLQIVSEEYHRDIQSLAVDVLFRFTQDESSRRMIRVLDGVQCAITLLTRSTSPDLVTKLADLLTCIAYDADGRAEIRQTGGVQVLLVRLASSGRPASRERERACSAASASAFAGADSPHRPSPAPPPVDGATAHTPASASPAPAPPGPERELDAAVCMMQSRICTTLTWLSTTDRNASLIREDNGIYRIAQLVLPPRPHGVDFASRPPFPPPHKVELQRHAFRALRFLFSLERNRRLFKRLFVAELFELFLRVKHYQVELHLYHDMVDFVNAMGPKDLEALTACIHETNVNREPERFIGDFGVLETLGQGAFGVVHKVQRRGAKELVYALKEILTKNASVFGTTANKQAQSKRSILNEVQILKSLNHPNVVRYYDAMEGDDRVYLLMQLVEGATLAEVVESESEKNKRFTEDRLWRIFIQLCTALRYLHKGAKVVHRDLKPGNIMLDWGDHVTVTDFGLAKQKESESSMMQSSVGTVQYSCPEVIQHQQYDSKADIWSLGCVLYQIAMLEAPFESKSVLALAKKIVEGKYAPITGYTDLVGQVVAQCLSVNADVRPDIDGVTRLIAPLLVTEIDRLQNLTSDHSTELQAERSRRRHHQTEAEQHKLTIHTLVRSQSVALDSSMTSVGLRSPQPLHEDGFLSPTRKLEASFHSSSSDDRRPLSAESSRSLPHMVGVASASASAVVPHAHGPPSDRRERGGHRSRRGSVDGPGGAAPLLDPLDSEVASSFASAAVSPRGRIGSRASRPPSSSSKTVRIGPSRVRSVDPITNMLNQLHKVIYISQLPAIYAVRPEEQPTFERNRHYIDRYKRELFTLRGQASSLKLELRQLSSGSTDTIAVDVGSVSDKREWNSLFDPTPGPAGEGAEHGPADAPPRKMTYTRLQQLIEETLQMCGYYDGGVPQGGGGVTLSRMDSTSRF